MQLQSQNTIGTDGFTGENLKNGLFSERELLEIEVANVIEHILSSGEEFIPGKSCGASDMRDIVISGMKGELGERFRLLKNLQNRKLIEEFVSAILEV